MLQISGLFISFIKWQVAVHQDEYLDILCRYWNRNAAHYMLLKGVCFICFVGRANLKAEAAVRRPGVFHRSSASHQRHGGSEQCPSFSCSSWRYWQLWGNVLCVCV